MQLLFGFLGGIGTGLFLGAIGAQWFVAKISLQTIDKVALSVRYPGIHTTPDPEYVEQEMEAAFKELEEAVPVPDWMEGE